MPKNEVLDILSLAIQAEVSAYIFYLRAVEKVTEDGMKIALRELARDEKDHFKVLESQYDSLHRSERWITYKDALRADGLPDIDEKVTESQKDMLLELEAKTTSKEVLEMGLEKEKRAYNFYKSQIENVSSAEGKEIFEQLMNFELGHVRRIESMIKRNA